MSEDQPALGAVRPGIEVEGQIKLSRRGWNAEGRGVIERQNFYGLGLMATTDRGKSRARS
jgi:hypothetical protein